MVRFVETYQKAGIEYFNIQFKKSDNPFLKECRFELKEDKECQKKS